MKGVICHTFDHLPFYINVERVIFFLNICKYKYLQKLTDLTKLEDEVTRLYRNIEHQSYCHSETHSRKGGFLILHITWNVDSKVSEENSAPLFRRRPK